MSKEKETGKEKRRIRQLARYYIPYKGLFFTDMFFAMLGAAITLVIPLIVRYITSTVVEKPLEQATGLLWFWLKCTVTFILPITAM